MHLSNLNPSIEQAATLSAEKLLGFYPPMPASEPQVFIAGLVELLCNYSIPTIQRATNPVHGLPGKFKFLPSIAEIREFLEMWEREECERVERAKRWKVPALPPSIAQFSAPKATATYSGLCELYGINAVPPGWDAIDVCRAFAVHGSRFQEFIDEAIKNRAIPPRRSVFQKVVDDARVAMERRQSAA